MKILIATGIFPPEIGGSATYSDMLFKELPKHGFEVRVLTYGAGRDKGVFYVAKRWPKGLRHLVYFAAALVLSLKSNVILAADSSFGAAFVSALAAKISGRRLIVRVTGDYAWEQGVQRFGVSDLIDEFQGRHYGWGIELLRFCQKFSVKKADLVIAPSYYLKKIILGWGIREDKVRVVYNAFEPLDPNVSKEEALTILGLEDKIIVSVGRLLRWKGFNSLIEIFYELREILPGWKLVIIGDGPERKTLESGIRNQGLEGRVILTGRLPRERLALYLKAADIFVLNTAYEGFSHQIIEAMAIGLSVITTTAGGNKEIIDNGKNGFLAGYNDQEHFKAIIIKLIGDAGLREKIGEEARLTTQQFSKNRLIGVLTTLLSYECDRSHRIVEGDGGVIMERRTGGGVEGRKGNWMRVLMISTDEKILEEDSEASERMREYGGLFEELHIIVFSRRGYQLSATSFQLRDNVWVYPTNSWLTILRPLDAYKIAKKIIVSCKLKIENCAVTTQDPFETGLVGWLIKRRYGFPLQIQVHTDFLSHYFWRESLKNKVRVLLAGFLLRQADGIRVVSERIKKSLVTSYQLPVTKITVLPIFVDVRKIRNAPIKTDLHKKYPDYDFIILMASRLTREKNVGLAIEAMAEIGKLQIANYKLQMANGKSILLLIVGSGPEEKCLKLKTKNYKLETNVIFEPWTDDLASYYKTADLFLLTSNYEGYGRAVVEAAAAGLPVVMTDVGVAGEIVRNGENGMVIRVGDKTVLSKALFSVIMDAELRSHFEQETKQIGTPLMNMNKSDYLRLYKECLEILII